MIPKEGYIFFIKKRIPGEYLLLPHESIILIKCNSKWHLLGVFFCISLYHPKQIIIFHQCKQKSQFDPNLKFTTITNHMDKGRTNYPICSKEQTTIEGLTTPLLTQLRNLPMMKAK